MKKLLVALLAGVVVSPVLADSYVNPYVRKDGTYVEGHYKSDANSTRSDNYSSQGNSNPYTGQRGSQRNESSDPPTYSKSSPAYVPNPYEQQQPRRQRSGW